MQTVVPGLVARAAQEEVDGWAAASGSRPAVRGLHLAMRERMLCVVCCVLRALREHLLGEDSVCVKALKSRLGCRVLLPQCLEGAACQVGCRLRPYRELCLHGVRTA